MFQTKKKTYLDCFKLFNADADRQKSQQSKTKKQKTKKQSIVQLHFINPNLLFLDARKPQRAVTALSKNNILEKRMNRTQTFPDCDRKMPIWKQNRSTAGRTVSRVGKRKLNNYIKVEAAFLNYQRSCDFACKKL